MVNEMQLNTASANKPNLILLDVYETMLNMADVERRVNNLFDTRKGYMLWFQLFMQYCFVDNCTVQFNNFSAIAKATMQMTAKELDREISEADINYVLELLKYLPLNDGVQEGLSKLSEGNYRIAALTNSPEKTVRERMERTGLISYFEMVLSAENIKKYKPCIEVYEWAAGKLNEDLSKILLVSAHGWDIAGGANAGMQTAFMKRGNQMLYPLSPKPNYTCKSLEDLSNQLVRL